MEKTNFEYDKSTWGKGPWNKEPDRVDFIYNGFSCLILRNSFGNWCGYVGVPNTHKLYGKNYFTIEDMKDVNIEVHGGITYTDRCSSPICHIPESGMPEDVWWIGFDTAHFMDLTVSNPLGMPRPRRGVYRDMNYTLAETRHLADQLAEIKEQRCQHSIL